jgi:hypothetical protein
MYNQRLIENPYRPGAGHTPPFLAGRADEQRFFRRLLVNKPITENILITGLRGVGKTVLLEQVRQTAVENRWLWVGNDLSESSALSEERLALRILTDLSHAITLKLAEPASRQQGILAEPSTFGDIHQMDRNAFAFEALAAQFTQAPGLPTDRLKAVLEKVTLLVKKSQLAGIVLAYDEAQCLSDRSEHNEFPMSMLIEIVGAMQKNQDDAAILLVLSGLPHVFDALTATRTYTERMFHVMTLDRLSWEDTNAALRMPLSKLMPPLHAPEDLLHKVARMTGGYPYLIQFFGRDLVDQILDNGGTLSAHQFPAPSTLDRLDNGLFAARWSKTTDKQRDILRMIALTPREQWADFSAAEISEGGAHGDFSTASVNQSLTALVERGLLFRTRHGRYAFTIPMSEHMILRRHNMDQKIEESWQQELHDSSVAAAAPQPAPQAAKKKRWFR